MRQSDLYRVYDRDPAPIVAFLEALRQRYALPVPGEILDMGCGPGALIEPLARAGWSVTAFEPDPDYAVAAREVANGLPNATVQQRGFLQLDEVDRFDLIAAVNGPFYYLLTPRERREALRRCARALRPRGALFLEAGNFLWILRNYREPPASEMEIEGTTVTRTVTHDIDYHTGTLTHRDDFRWTDRQGAEQTATKTHRMALLSFPEIEYLLHEEGLGGIETFNSYQDREPARLEGRRMLIAARLGSDPSHRGSR